MRRSPNEPKTPNAAKKNGVLLAIMIAECIDFAPKMPNMSISPQIYALVGGPLYQTTQSSPW